MTEAEIYANPQRIRSLADELRMFVGSLRTELEKLNSGLHGLGATWRDKEYEKFKRSFDRLKEELEKLDGEIIQREPELKEDARLLLEYLNKAGQ